MQYIWFTVPFSFAAIMIFTFLAFRKCDQIIRKIYNESKELWQRLGKPLGFIWVPKEASTFSFKSNYSRSNLYTLLASKNLLQFSKHQEAINQIEGIQEDMYRLRKYHFYGNLAILVWVLDIACCMVLTWSL